MSCTHSFDTPGRRPFGPPHPEPVPVSASTFTEYVAARVPSIYPKTARSSCGRSLSDEGESIFKPPTVPPPLGGGRVLWGRGPAGRCCAPLCTSTSIESEGLACLGVFRSRNIFLQNLGGVDTNGIEER